MTISSDWQKGLTMRRLQLLCCLATLSLIACGGSASRRDDDSISGGGSGGGGQGGGGRATGPKLSEDEKLAFQSAVADYKAQKQTGQLNYEALAQTFEKVVDDNPRLAEGYYNLGCIYEAMGDEKKAIKNYEKALSINPGLTLAAANWGAMLARQGRTDDALSLYQRGLSKDAKNSAVLLNMAAIYRERKAYDKALKAAADVLARDPANVGAYRIMASVYYDKGDMDMAHLICLRGLKVKQNDARLANTLGLVLIKLERVPEALAQFRIALQQEPDMIPTRFNIAKIALDYKDFRVAVEEFAKILEYEPQNKKASIGLGIALRGAGEHEKAKRHFEAMVVESPNEPIPHYWLGVLALKNFSNQDVAMNEFRTFVKLSGSRLPSGHPVYAYMDEVKQQVMASKKMAEEEKRQAVEQQRMDDLIKKLAEARKKTLDEEWAKAEKNGDPLPPAKLEADKLPYLIIPIALPPPTRSTKVRLVHGLFKGTKEVFIGTMKAKFKLLSETMLEFDVPRGLAEGGWDIMVTFTDKEEAIFQQGLWIANKPKKKPGDKGGKSNAAEPAPPPDLPGDSAEAAPPKAGKPKKKKESRKEQPPADEPKDPGGADNKPESGKDMEPEDPY